MLKIMPEIRRKINQHHWILVLTCDPSTSLPFGRGSRVEGKWSRVEKFFTIIFERRQIKISYRPVFTRVSGARFIE